MINKDLYLIESNHDEIMLMDGPYPRVLKERVISDKGHLSNTTTAKYLQKQARSLLWIGTTMLLIIVLIPTLISGLFKITEVDSGSGCEYRAFIGE